MMEIYLNQHKPLVLEIFNTGFYLRALTKRGYLVETVAACAFTLLTVGWGDRGAGRGFETLEMRGSKCCILVCGRY